MAAAAEKVVAAADKAVAAAEKAAAAADKAERAEVAVGAAAAAAGAAAEAKAEAAAAAAAAAVEAANMAQDITHDEVLPAGGEAQFTSQGGQDRFLLEKVFKGNIHRNKGFFIEFGARNGVEHSNTHYFEKVLGWRGVLLEAVPREHGNIARDRPNSAVFNGAVCEGDSISFLVTDLVGWSGIETEYDNSRFNQMKDMPRLKVKCHTLRKIVKQFGIKRINYLSVDTEGSELPALKTFPFDEVTVDVIGVEALLGSPDRDAKKEQLIAYMISQNYVVLEEYKFADDTADVFFVPKDRSRMAKSTDIMYNPTTFLDAKQRCVEVHDCLQ